MDCYKDFLAGVAESNIKVLKDQLRWLRVECAANLAITLNDCEDKIYEQKDLDLLYAEGDFEALVFAADDKVDELAHALYELLRFWEATLERCKPKS